VPIGEVKAFLTGKVEIRYDWREGYSIDLIELEERLISDGQAPFFF